MDRRLPSWRDGPTKRALVGFLQSCVRGPEAVAPDERVAVAREQHAELDRRRGHVLAGRALVPEAHRAARARERALGLESGQTPDDAVQPEAGPEANGSTPGRGS